jgi:hypothetical protein
MRAWIVSAMVFAAACGGGAADEEEPPPPPLRWLKSCLWEWGLPGVPGTGGPVYRCYYVAECRTTNVCDNYPEHLRSLCPYLDSSCTACPADKPLLQC